MGLLRVACLLPHRVALAIGRLLGRIAYSLGGSRVAIVRRNIELCFPDLSAGELDNLTYEHFKALGMSVIEMGLGRWASTRRLKSITKLVDVENLLDALATGRGVILLAAHFTTLEISGRVLADAVPPFDAVFRKNRSEFLTELQRSGREVSADTTIEKRDIKKMVRSLRNNRAVWYAPDQSYNRKGSEAIEFFGVPAMHTTATSTLAKDGTYELILLPAFEGFPSDDPVADTKRYITALEEHIRSCPEQYFWIHRKFKDLPDGYPDYYADLDASK